MGWQAMTPYMGTRESIKNISGMSMMPLRMTERKKARRVSEMAWKKPTSIRVKAMNTVARQCRRMKPAPYLTVRASLMNRPTTSGANSSSRIVKPTATATESFRAARRLSRMRSRFPAP